MGWRWNSCKKRWTFLVFNCLSNLCWAFVYFKSRLNKFIKNK